MVTIDLFRNEENTQPFAGGQKIFSEGEPGSVMYVVVEGEVDLLVHGAADAELCAAIDADNRRSPAPHG